MGTTVAPLPTGAATLRVSKSVVRYLPATARVLMAKRLARSASDGRRSPTLSAPDRISASMAETTEACSFPRSGATGVTMR